jgi:hypothetical protein
MKRKISKAEFDALSDAMKAFYKLEGADYLLQIEGEDDPAELRRARDREKQTAKEEKERADALQAKLDDITNVDARKKGDIDAIENSWKEKLRVKELELTTQLNRLKQQVNQLLVKSSIVKLASDVAGDNADLLMPHLEKRVVVEYDGDVPKLRILDAEGKPSALTIEELEKEIVANKKFASIIIASRASGGADSGNKNGNRSAVQDGKKFSELTEAERIDFHKRDPQGFEAASKKAADEAALARRRM